MMTQRLSTPHPVNGLNVTERAVLDLWDAGMGSKLIGEALPAVSDKRIASILHEYACAAHEVGGFDAMVRAASKRLAAACVATGGRFL